MQTKKFQRVIEDFACENCGIAVKGDGFTNHCPQCLWSKHVDRSPGDREETCQALMRPIGIEVNSDIYILTHRCTKCGIKKKNKIGKEDSFDAILKISANQVE